MGGRRTAARSGTAPRLHPDQCPRRLRRADVRIRLRLPPRARTPAPREARVAGGRPVGHGAAGDAARQADWAARRRDDRRGDRAHGETLRHDRQGLHARQRGQPRRGRVVSRSDGRPTRRLRARSRLPGQHHAGDPGDAPSRGRRAPAHAAGACGVRQPGPRRHRRRAGARRRAAGRPPRGGRARRVPGGAAAARACLLADAEPPHHVAHRGAQRPARHRAGVHRQLPPPAARRAAAASGGFRAGY